MKNFCIILFSFFLSSCWNSKTASMDYSAYYSRPKKSRYFNYAEGKHVESKSKFLNKWIKSDYYQIATESDRLINDDLILTLAHKDFKLNNQKKLYGLIHRFSKVPMKLDYNVESKNVPYKFKQFLPFHEDSTKIRHLLPKSSFLSGDYFQFNPYYYDYQIGKYSQRGNYCKDLRAHQIKYDYFPSKFYFPVDYVPMETACSGFKMYLNEDLIEFDSIKEAELESYLVLDLPKTLDFFQCRRPKEEIDSMVLENKFNGGKFNLNVECKKSYFLLTKTNLLLEPAFVTYQSEISNLWHFYLVNIRFNELNDTIFDTGNVSSLEPPTFGTYFMPMVDLIQKRYYHNFSSARQNTIDKIRLYLEEDFNKQQEVFKSYFELILWKMYECTDFMLKRNNYDKASFVFTSNNPKYPGNYEVFFSIYEPNEFKVKKRR